MPAASNSWKSFLACGLLTPKQSVGRRMDAVCGEPSDGLIDQVKGWHDEEDLLALDQSTLDDCRRDDGLAGTARSLQHWPPMPTHERVAEGVDRPLLMIVEGEAH